MNYNDLAREAHENAVAHGWWDGERPFAEIIGLIHSELSEALEEYRDGNHLEEIYFSCSLDRRACPSCINFPNFELCKFDKPEGIPVELADVIIRIADYFGRQGMVLSDIRHHYSPKQKDLMQLIADCHSHLSKAYRKPRRRYKYLKIVVVEIMSFYNRQGLLGVIEKAIHRKMAYNKTRPHKHGKKI